ncbi:cobalamin B12-binding domain-containing protein [Methanosarcina sp. T3]|uniref:cobalamin B12-binding domain-containing protein n=1 Tax=Methanosarcina sp. T3 TaxID=3439062 RepID=UPI003F8709D4
MQTGECKKNRTKSIKKATKMSKQVLLEQLSLAVLNIDETAGVTAIENALSEGLSPVEIIEKGLSVGMLEIGSRFENGEIFLPQVMMAASVMNKLVDKVKKDIPATEKKEGIAKVVLGTVEGDVHDIGKNIVKILLQANGFEVYDLGRDALLTSFVEKVKEIDADIVASSALMTGTMQGQAALEEMLKEAGIRDKVKTMVGGAPCTEHWAKKIGADAYAENASEAVTKAREMLKA